MLYCGLNIMIIAISQLRNLIILRFEYCNNIYIYNLDIMIKKLQLKYCDSTVRGLKYHDNTAS